MTLRELQTRSSIILTSVVLITGCELGNLIPGGEEPPTGAENEVRYEAEPAGAPRQHFTRALEHLEQGREGQAKAELEAYLGKVPRSTRAQLFLDQINTDSDDYFPYNSFSVKLRSGESLSTLAEKYLGSALKFYALAKYNNISNPSQVDIGQTIYIPLTPLAIKVRQGEDNIESEQEFASGSDEEGSPSDIASAIADEQEAEAQLSDNELAETAPPEATRVTPATLKSDLATFSEIGDYESAANTVDALRKFGELDEQSRALALVALVGHGNQIAQSNSKLASSRFAEAAEINLVDGDEMAALSNFKRAVELNPKNQQLENEFLVLQRGIADKYHREASAAFRRQELDTAIAKWDKVLEVDPYHTNANVYRAQAIDLKERMEKLKE